MSSCPYVLVSPCACVPMSLCPIFSFPKDLNFQLNSRLKFFPMSSCPHVHSSPCPHVPMSACPLVLVSLKTWWTPISKPLFFLKRLQMTGLMRAMSEEKCWVRINWMKRNIKEEYFDISSRVLLFNIPFDYHCHIARHLWSLNCKKWNYAYTKKQR